MQGIRTSISSCTQSFSTRMFAVGQSNTTDNSLPSRPAHRRHDSDELDVFDAVRYFAGGIDGVDLAGRPGPQRDRREDGVVWSAERRILDIPMKTVRPQECQRVENCDSKEKKCKQPSSPGGRLASFLSSIFNQTANSKKKSKSRASTKSKKDGELDERHAGMSRRRSLSHFQSIRSSDSRSIYSSESSRVSTPIPHTIVQKKSHKESCSKSNGQPMVAAFSTQGEAWDERRIEGDAWLYDKSKVLGIGKPAMGSNEGWSENKWVLYGSKDGFFKKHGDWREEFTRKEQSREEDGGETDSSSDLFELKNYDCGELSSGLPAYGTTDIEIIRRGVAAPSVPF